MKFPGVLCELKELLGLEEDSTIYDICGKVKELQASLAQTGTQVVPAKITVTTVIQVADGSNQVNVES